MTPMFMIALSAVAISMFGHFLFVPNLSIFFQFNLGFPREQIGLLYLFGGIFSIVTIRLCGQLSDKGMVLQVLIVTSLVIVLTIYMGFIQKPEFSVYLIFILFMAASSSRTASVTTVRSRVPLPHQRVAYMTYQGALSGIVASMASIVSSLVCFQITVEN